MRKLFAFLVSGIALCIYTVLIEVALIIVLYLWASYTPGWPVIVANCFIIALILLQVVCFFVLIYKRVDSEFKIPWAVVLLILPGIGCLIYLMFSPKGMRKKDRKILEKTEELSNQYFGEEDFLKENYGSAVKTFNYLVASSNRYPTSCNKVHFYKNGESFFPDFVNCLKEAKEFIFLEFFIIGSGKIWNSIHEVLVEKAKQGVEIRLLFDDVGCVGKLPFRYTKKLNKEGIKAVRFNRHAFTVGVYNNRDHRKIAIIDHKYAFTGGMNLANEYANVDSPFGYWKDTMVRMQGKSIKVLLQMFLQMYDVATNSISDYKKYLIYQYDNFDEPGAALSFGHGPKPFYSERVGEHTFINIIESATKRVDICTPYFIPSEGLLYAIRRASLSGVKINLFLPGIPDKKIVYTLAQTYFPTLLSSNVNVYLYKPGFNHEKCMIADGKIAFVGTINMDYRSLVHHFECGTVLYKNPCLQEIQQDFEDMILVSQKVDDTFKINIFKKIICAIVKLFAPLL